MSLFHQASIDCPNCGTSTQIMRAGSVNGDLRPDLRAAILDGSFQAETCPQCGTTVRLPPHLTFIELDRNIWIAVESAEQIEDWSTLEDQVWKTYDRAFGSSAPPSVRDLVEHVRPRLVFGWPALREKLVAADLGLDDITLELLKMSVMRNVDGSPITDETELRLVSEAGETLRFAWVHQVSEEVLSVLEVPRDVFDSIDASPEPWAAVRAKLEGVFFVDLRRFIAGAEAARAA